MQVSMQLSYAGGFKESAQPGVVGIGLARRDSGYVVKVDVADAAAAGMVPRDVDGVRVVTEVIGVVRPL